MLCQCRIVLLPLITVLSSSELTGAERPYHLDIDVRERAEVSLESIIRSADMKSPVTDTGEWLKQVNGVTASRKGGKGFEPIIRGQQNSQLSIIAGDAVISSACPGRMDPVSSYISMAGYDRIRVVHGYESVLNGPGGSGGSVLFERNEPEFNGSSVLGRIHAGYKDNINSRNLSADMTAGTDSEYVRVYGELQEAGNYRDGDGKKVSSAFQSNSGGILLTGDLSEAFRLELNLEAIRDKNVHYSGNGMDAPEASADIWRFKLKRRVMEGFIDEQELSVYYSAVDHLMDNYSVRLRNPNNAFDTKTPSTTQSWGGRWLNTSFFNQTEISFGVDYRVSEFNAKRYRVARRGHPQILQSLLWPEVDFHQWGLFAEVDYQLTDRNSLRAGIRYDDLTAGAGNTTNAQLGGGQPAALYQTYYGDMSLDYHERSVSAVAAWQHALSSSQWLEFRASRSVRSADVTERYIASRGSCCHGSDDWVGNPLIKPEKHYQLDTGFYQKNSNIVFSAVAFIDDISDYILRKKSDSGALLYQNIHARLYGIEMEAGAQWGAFRSGINIAVVRGDNQTHDSNLPQIPAISSTVSLDYVADVWSVGSRCEISAEQDNVDMDSGLDAGVSSGFSVWHLYGYYQIHKTTRLTAGIDNLFDRTYALHVNRASHDPFSPEALRVNEPGRQLWLGLSVSF